MTGKVIIVTGASAGIGYEVARALCEGGNDVILACRSEERANRSIEKIRKQNPSALATYMQLDLADLASVRKFVDDFHATGKKLTVLINNAGIIQMSKDNKRLFTKDNFELTMGTNHLGPFLLTNLLLDDLKRSAKEGVDARIVVVSSQIHDVEFAKKRGSVQPLDVDNFFLAGEGTYSGLQAYKNSKLANILFTYELSRQLEGSGVKVNAICPGFVPTTELTRQSSGAARFYGRYVLHGLLRFTKQTRTVQQACAGIYALALGEKLKDVTGKVFFDGAEMKTSAESMDMEKQKKVWAMSAGYTHLPGYEPLNAPSPPVEEVSHAPPEVKKEPGVTAAVAANGNTATMAVEAAGEKPAEAQLEVKAKAKTQAEVKQEVQSESPQEVKKEGKQELAQEAKQEAKQELTQEAKQEAKQELREEAHQEAKQELAQEAKQELAQEATQEKETKPEAKSEAAHESKSEVETQSDTTQETKRASKPDAENPESKEKPESKPDASDREKVPAENKIAEEAETVVVEQKEEAIENEIVDKDKVDEEKPVAAKPQVAAAE